MTSDFQDAPEACGSSETFESRSWFHHEQTKADAFFRKWCLSWRDGTELEEAIAVLENALHYAETLPNIEPAVPAELLRRQGTYYQDTFFRRGKRHDAEEAARCLLQALQYEPSDFLTMTNLSWIYMAQAGVTGSRMMLDDAIDLSENAVVQTHADHEAYSSGLKVAAMCLMQRAQFDGCHDDLEIAVQLLRVGVALPNLAHDDPAILRLLLAEIHLLQFESLENLEHIDRVASLLGQVPSPYPVGVLHEPHLNELCGKMYKTKWEFFRTRNDLAASFSAYMTMHQAIQKNSACPSWNTTDALLGCADVLRIRSGHYDKYGYLSKSYLIANIACIEARKRASEWHLSSISRVEAQAQFVLGETLRDRYIRYRATQLLEDAISAFRQSVLMTDLKDVDFVERAVNLSAVLRIRSTGDQINHYQRQAHLYEARQWAGKLILSRMPLRRWQRVGCILELGNLLWRSGAPVDRVIPLYQRAVELDTMHFDLRVVSWLSLAEALISRGHDTECTKDLDTAGEYLDKAEMLERQRNNGSTGRLPVAASLQSEYHRLTVSDGLLKNACYLVPPDIFSLVGSSSQLFLGLHRFICMNAYHALFRSFAGRPFFSQLLGLPSFRGTGTTRLLTLCRAISPTGRKQPISIIRFFPVLPIH